MAVVDYLNSNNELIKVDSLKGPQMAILASDTNNVVDYLATNSIYVQVETPQGPQTAILIENAGVDGGLTPTQELTLAHIEYDSSEDKIAADVPLMTTLNSFYLGEQHKISSGGENIFFTNLTSDLVFTPVWAGIK
ncbi:MAG: hypothetical protein GY804_01215, partial [Alphaproteobacteria bacterium]|nr:hypothetical protein [Alphaproteobacteria bacterium]